MAERKALSLAAVRVARPDGAKPPPPRNLRQIQAPNSPSRLGIAGYVLHGVVFGSLAVFAVAHFGPVFLFISTLIGAISLFSLYQAYTLAMPYRASLRRPKP
jgi:hypothetical protein